MSGSLAPTQAGFVTFAQQVMQLSPNVLPVNSPAITTAFAIAMEIVNPAIAAASAIIYQQAVYNLAADTLINIAQDQDGYTVFIDARATYGINAFLPGEISAASDQGTSESVMTPDWVRTLTLAQLQNLKTPYGRVYLGYAQTYGSMFAVA